MARLAVEALKLGILFSTEVVHAIFFRHQVIHILTIQFRRTRRLHVVAYLQHDLVRGHFRLARESRYAPPILSQPEMFIVVRENYALVYHKNMCRYLFIQRKCQQSYKVLC
eukprot:GEMP01098600.1.p1 GENE.GEMP01098600.1~~GEMP01098600.1.p1  ORF type:complete len:111 (-),score=1.09 GEMP01098600.1:222-554(-)